MLAGLIAVCALAADPQLVVRPLGVARPDCLLRVEVRCADPPPESSNAVRLDVALTDGERLLSTAGLDLGSTADLAGPHILVLRIPALRNGELRVRASATWPGSPGMPRRALIVETAVATPSAMLAQAIATVARLRSSGATDPLPWLWAEGIAEFAAGGADAASIGDMAVCLGRLGAWLDGQRPAGPQPGRNELALRDPVDGSVQPWRLHLPPGRGPFPCALLLPPVHNSAKLRWPDWEARQVQAALEAGCAVIECHPAGDAGWSGAARRRIGLVLAAAGLLGAVDTTRGVALCHIAVRGLPFAVHAPTAVATDPSWWRSAIAQARPVVPATPDWADAPFAIVVGTGEHTAAATANRALAASFRAAYAAHALAVVDTLDDTCDPARLAGRNLVLVGNPRSNRVLAQLGLELPFAWDHRIVTGPDGFRALRATGPFTACRTITADGRHVLVMDGAPPSWGAGLPLADATLPLALSGR